MTRLHVLALGLVLACRPYETRASVRIPGPDGMPSPVAHLPVVFLPYDRDSVLAALAATAATPSPEPGLDSLLAASRPPLAAYTRAAWSLDSAHRALDSLRSALDTTPRNAEAYRQGYAAFVAGTARIATFESAARDAQAALARSDARLADLVARQRARVRAWEDSTYRRYPEITAALERASGLAPVADTTDAVGDLVVTLPRGTWWLYARAPDVADPYAEWYWNVRVRGTLLRLDRTNAVHRPRP